MVLRWCLLQARCGSVVGFAIFFLTSSFKYKKEPLSENLRADLKKRLEDKHAKIPKGKLREVVGEDQQEILIPS